VSVCAVSSACAHALTLSVVGRLDVWCAGEQAGRTLLPTVAGLPTHLAPSLYLPPPFPYSPVDARVKYL
jgi:hypothetical protein